MIKRNGKRITSIAIAASLMGQSLVPVFAQNNSNDKTTIDFKVMATSDLHANLMNYDYFTGSTTNNTGLVKAATVIKEEKVKADKSQDEKIDNVLLVDNGDTIEGTPLANLYAIKNPVKPGQKYPVYEALESLGYDMTTVGNHEVNYGMNFIKQITKANTTMGTVCANIKDSKTGQLVFDPYKILTETVVDSKGQERELKIGITGVVPTQILNWDKVMLNGEITVDEMDEAVKTYTKKMKDEGADIVVVLAHTGYGTETTDVKGLENAGYAISMIDGVDVVVGGHVHQSAKYNVKKSNGDITQYVQPLNAAKEVGVVDLKIDVNEDENGNVTYSINDDETTINNISTKDKANDAATEAVVKKYHEATDAYVNAPSGQITKDLNSFFTLVADDPSVQIVSDAQKAYVENLIKNNDASLAKYKDLPILSVAAPFKAGTSADNYVDIKAGGLAIRDLSNLYKYDNTVSVVKLTGSDVKEWVEFCTNMFNTIDLNSTEEQDLINRDFPTFLFDVIDGIEYEIDVTKDPKYDKNGKVINTDSSRISKITYNGEPLDLDQEFLLATNNYRAGGNSFPWQGRQEIVYNSTDESRDVLKKYIEDAGKLEPSVDNNWSFKTIDSDVNVYFTSHENGANYLENYPNISTNKEVAGDRLYKYYYDFSAKNVVEDDVNQGGSESVDGVVKVEIKKENLKEILTKAIKEGYTLKVNEEEGNTIIKIYNPKTRTEQLVAILTVKNTSAKEVNTLIEEINTEIKENTTQDGNNSNTEGNKEESNNSNTTNPSSPQTGDTSMLGLVGVGVAAIAGIFVNNRRKK